MRRLLLAIFLFLPLSAQAVPDALFPRKGEYEKTLNRHTQSGSHYSIQDLHAQFIWYATYASEEFRRAFRAEYDKVYPQGQEHRAQERALPWIQSGSEATFFVAIYARKREMMDLGSPKSLQDISLEVDGRFYKPTLIEKIKVTPFETRFFNYLNLWYSAYRIVFPTEISSYHAAPFKLHLNGAVGRSVLNFK